MGPGDDVADRIDRADRIAGIAHGDELGPRRQLGFEVLEIEGHVGRVDVDGVDGHAPVGGHRPPGADVGLVVEGRDDDLVTRAERRADRSPEVKGQARHVLAELDLVGAGRTEEVGDRGVGFLDDRVGALAGRERPARVRVRVAVVADDRVDHPLRDLRATRSVEECDRPAILLAGERRELRPQGFDIEPGHLDSSLTVARERNAPTPGRGPDDRGSREVFRDELRQAAEPDRRQPGTDDDEQEPGGDEREGDFLALLGVADSRLEVGVDRLQVLGGRGRRTTARPWSRRSARGSPCPAGRRGGASGRTGRPHRRSRRGSRGRWCRSARRASWPGRPHRAVGRHRPSSRRRTAGWRRRAAGSTGWSAGSFGAPEAAGSGRRALRSARRSRRASRRRRPVWIFSAMSRTCMSASPMAVPSRACQAVEGRLELGPVGGRADRG